MIPAHFPMMVVAELRKTFSKGSGIAALIVALLVGILTAAAVYQVQHMEGASINGTSVSELVTVDAVQIAGYALRVRNFFVLPMFLVLGMAGSVAGELSDRTLRELLVRPVSRASVLFAKLTASGILSLITLTLTLLPAFALGALLFGLPKEEVSSQILKVLAAYGASFLADLGWLSIAMTVSLFIHSAGGVVVGVVFGLGLDMALRAFLWALEKIGAEKAAMLRPFTLTYGLDAWQGWSEGWEPARFVSLTVLLGASLAIALARFRRMDVL